MDFLLPPDPDEGPQAQAYGYSEARGSPMNTKSRDGIALITKYQVDYVEAEQFEARLLGTAYYKNDQILTRRLPHKYPPRGGRTGPIYCVATKCSPWPQSKAGTFPGINTNLYTFAEIEATYSSLSYLVGTNPLNIVPGGVSPTDIGQDGTLYYSSVEFSTAAGTFPLPAQTMIFAKTKTSRGEPKVLDTTLPIPIPNGTLHITRHWVPFPSGRPLMPLRNDIYSLIGTTNLFPMFSGFFPAASLEYLGAQTRTVNTPLGNMVEERKMAFKFYPNGVNFFPIADPKNATGIYDELLCKADPTIKVFRAADWAPLWA